MKCELISIGSELTTGQNLDTNAQWLSLRLAEIGLPVAWHTTIADDFQDNIEAFRLASQRAQLVISTGGLGATQDDLTREVLARVAGVELVFHQESFDHIQALFARRQRVMSERNRAQALFPHGAEAIPNANGTAPGIWMNIQNAVVISMPGVPSEMYAMYETQVKPRLLQLGLGGGVLLQRKINCFGVGEVEVERSLLDLTRRDHVPEVGITVSDAVISLRIFARADNVAAAQAQIAPVEAIIRERLGELVFGVADEELQHAVVRLLEQRRLTLSTAESVTGGLVAHRLVQVAGASQCYAGGLVTYDNRLKTSLLGVSAALLEEHGAVSAPVAEAMAVACRLRLGTDLAVSVVGLAGPGGASTDKPIGLVFAALAWDGGVRSAQHNWGGNRLEIQSRAAKMALNLVRLHLQRQPLGV